MNKDNEDFEDDEFGGGFGESDFDSDDEFDMFDEDDEEDENPFSLGDDEDEDVGEDSDDDFDDIDEDDDDGFEMDEDDDDDTELMEFEGADPLSQDDIDSMMGGVVEAAPEKKKKKSNVVGMAIYAVVGVIGLGGAYVAYQAAAPMIFGAPAQQYIPPQQDFVPKGTGMPSVAPQQAPSGAPTAPMVNQQINVTPAAPVQQPVANNVPAAPVQQPIAPMAPVQQQPVAPMQNQPIVTMPTPQVAAPVEVSANIEEKFDEIAQRLQGFDAALGVIMDNMENLPKYFATSDQVATIVNSVVDRKLAEFSMEPQDNTEVLEKIASLEKVVSSNGYNSEANSSQLSMIQNQIDYLMAQKTTNNSSDSDEKIASLEAKLDGFMSKIETLEGVISSQKKELSKVKSQKTKVVEKIVEVAPKVVKGANVQPPRKPSVLTNYRLAGVSRDMAWIETSAGVSKVQIGQNINGVGVVQGITQVDGNWAVVTPLGLILP